ncbi:MAG: hypothetical protein ACR2OZ_10700 [Verrucomicrobiales bacterium]
MKKLLTIISAVFALAAFSSNANADHRRFIGYDHCGNALYSVTYVVGYDCHGCPIYRSRTETVRRPRPRCDDDYAVGYGGYYRSRRSNCDSGVRIHSPRGW